MPAITEDFMTYGEYFDIIGENNYIEEYEKGIEQGKTC